MTQIKAFLKDHTFKMILIFSFLAIVFAVLFVAYEWQIVEGGRFFKLTLIFAIPAGMLMAGSVMRWMLYSVWQPHKYDDWLPEESPPVTKGLTAWGLPYCRLQIRYASGKVVSFKGIKSLVRAKQITAARGGTDMHGYNKLKDAVYYDSDHQRHDIQV